MNCLRLLLLPMLVVAISLSGCSKGPARVSVSGEVKYLDKPIPVGTVTFVSPTTNVVESSPIQNGRYTIAHAPIGSVKIAVNTPPPASAMQMKQKVPGKTLEASATESVKLPDRFTNPEKSGLEYTVTSDATQTKNLDLK